MPTLQTWAPDPRSAHSDHNLFFAARPPRPVADRIRQVWQLAGTDSRLRESTLHLSILPVERAATPDPWLVDDLCSRMDRFRFPAFTLVFDRLQTWQTGIDKHDRAIVLTTENGHDSLRAMADALRAKALPGRHPKTALRPHVTLAYGPGFAEERLLAVPVRWTITEVVLVDSLVGQTRHVPLGRWPLSAH